MSDYVPDRSRASRSMSVEGSKVNGATVVLVYAVGLWLVWLGSLSGTPVVGAPSLVGQWLPEATMALPVALGVVHALLWLTTRLLGDARSRTSALLSAALGTAVAFAVASPVTATLAGAPTGGSSAAGIARDALLGLAVAVPLALLTAAAGAAPWRRLSWRVLVPGRRTVARVSATAIALTSLGLAPLMAAGSASAASDTAGQPCPAGVDAAHQKTFDITAIDGVKVPLNRYGDNDPQGRMYVATKVDGADNLLTSPGESPKPALDAIKAQQASQKVSIGLRDDPIQPLSIRANEGDCVTIAYTNSATARFGLHIDGLAFDVASSGDSVGRNADSAVAPGGTATYRFWIPKDANLEGSHYIHPGPGNRSAVDHGLFGTLTVEPPDSVYLDASTADKPLLSGWEAIIAPKNAPSFREAVKMHHEIGNDNETIKTKDGVDVPQVDAVTGSYRPGEFALNYRSEPFRNRLLTAGREKSHSYSSYTFGDPATPMPRGYIGDPTKFRLVHAGGEKFHVYHLHGGGDRWRYSPVADTTFHYADTALQKHPKTVDSPSNRLDAQSIGPGESYNLELEGGAGGVQHSVGDLLFHCHIAKHYVSGMWSFWRVYDTLQPQSLGQDALAPLPDRAPFPEAVDSTGLIGKTMPDGTTLTKDNIDAWIRPQLPPSGDRTKAAGANPVNTQDPSVWNWKVEAGDPAKPVYYGEPEDTASPALFPDLRTEVTGHPGLLPIDLLKGESKLSGAADGNRPRLLFSPLTGRPAYPMLRTHAGTRPPFSPNGHSGSPFLGELGDQKAAAGKVDPWAARPDGLCPRTTAQGDPTPIKHFNITSVGTTVRRTPTVNDPEGKLFVLSGTQDKVKADLDATPLAIRTNVGDCDRVTLTNEMPDTEAFDGWSKNTIHIHHVQFDVQGSDGVSTGFAFEHSVRPYKQPTAPLKSIDDRDPQLTQATSAGDTVLHLTDVTKFIRTDANGNASQPFIAVGEGTNGIEVRQIKSVDAGASTVTLTEPLGPGTLAPGDKACPPQSAGETCTDNAQTGEHAVDEYAGYEFIQYEWYADVLLDNIFWHDHVDGIHGWGHGLVGQLVVEPAGSSYTDPRTGDRLDSGTIADIHVNPSAPGYTPVAKGVKSFRELTTWTIDDNDRGAYSTFGLKAAPFAERPDAANRFSSYTYGDPLTPLPRAYPGDPVVIRSINVGPSMDTIHFQGPRFLNEFRLKDAQGNPEGSLIDTLHNGMSEKFTIVLNGGPGTTDRPGDYLYTNGDARRTADGAWGILRVLDGKDSSLEPLPDHSAPAGQATSFPAADGSAPPLTNDPGDPCPGGAKVDTFHISAIDVPHTTGNGQARAAFVDTANVNAITRKNLSVTPMVLHVAAGDCVVINFRNDRASLRDAAGVETHRASFSPGKLLRDAASSGVNVGYSSQQTVAPNGGNRTYRFYADKEEIGTSVVSDMGSAEAVGSQLGLYGAIVVGPEHAVFTDPVTGAVVDRGVSVDVNVPGKDGYRDFTTIVADSDAKMGQDFMPYPTDADPKSSNINYQNAPLGDGADSFSGASPATPMLMSYAGDPVLVHEVSAPGSEQAHVFSLGGLAAPRDRYVPRSELTANQSIGPWEAFDAQIAGGAGGWSKSVGDFFYGDMRRPFTQNGLWGIQRVLPRTASCTGPLACLAKAPVVDPPPVVPPPVVPPPVDVPHGVPAPELRVPGAPKLLSAIRGNKAATVQWTAPADNGGLLVTGYRVEVLRGSHVDRVVAVDRSTSRTVVRSLRNGTAYRFRVRAVNSLGAGSASATSAVVVPATVAGAPRIAVARSGARGGVVSATARWRAPSDDGGTRVTGFSVVAQRLDARGRVVGTVTSARVGSTRHQLALTLRPGRYRFRVVAWNAVGHSTRSAASNAVSAR